MTGETERLIRSLQEKISTIQNETLRFKEENEALKEDLTKKEVDFDNQTVVLSELKNKYNALKIARSLKGEDKEEMKKRIDAMVKEIETCIELIDQ